MPTSHTPLSGAIGLTKEGPPITASSFGSEMPKPVSEPVVISPEVAQYIEQHDAAQIPPDVRAMGISSSDDRPTLPDITLPISDEQIVTGLKKPIGSSWRWLSEFLTYRLRQMGVAIKRFPGGVRRVQTT